MDTATTPTAAERLKAIPGAEFNDKNPAATGYRFEAVIPETALRDTASALRTEGYFLETIACVDWSECFERSYHTDCFVCSHYCAY